MFRTDPIPVADDHRNPLDPAEAERYGVTVNKEPGRSAYVLSGEYDDLINFMVDCLGMTSSEADIEIGEGGDFDHNEDVFADAEARELSARTDPSGRPFEGRKQRKLVESDWTPAAAGVHDSYGVDDIEVGDKVDVYMPDSFATFKEPVRVTELVDDVWDAVGYDPDKEQAHKYPEDVSEEFKGPGFVGEFTDDAGENGTMVFAVSQIVPGSKEKYLKLMDDDPYLNQKNYDRDEGEDPSVSDYYNDDDSRAEVPWRAKPFHNPSRYFPEGNMTPSLKSLLLENPPGHDPITDKKNDWDNTKFYESGESAFEVDLRYLNPETQNEVKVQLEQKLSSMAAVDFRNGMFVVTHFNPESYDAIVDIIVQTLEDVSAAYGVVPAQEEGVVYNEAFDRFMDRILIQESPKANRKLVVESDSRQRIRAARHQERPLGRIRMGGHK